MSKRKCCYEFTEHRQYKCCECGRTTHKPKPHYDFVDLMNLQIISKYS